MCQNNIGSAISRVVVCLLLMDMLFLSDARALAPQPGTQKPEIRREADILALILGGRLKYARTQEDKDFLAANNADALLLSHGKILAAENLEKDHLKLIRAIIHEQIEAIMQIAEREGGSNYSSIVGMILGTRVQSPQTGKAEDIRQIFLELFPDNQTQYLSDKLLANHITAVAFELLITTRLDRLIEESDLSDKEKMFLNIIEPIINANIVNYFTSEFWSKTTREDKIRIAMANGQTFYQVANESVGTSAVKNKKKARSSDERASDRQKLLDALDNIKEGEPSVNVAELASITGIPKETIYSDIYVDGSGRLRGHPKLIIKDIDIRTQDVRDDQLQALRDAIDKVDIGTGITITELSRAIAVDYEVVQRDIKHILASSDGYKYRGKIKIEERDRRSKSEIGARREKIKEALVNGSRNVAELIEMTGLSGATIRNDIKLDPDLGRLVKEGRIIISQRRIRGTPEEDATPQIETTIVNPEAPAQIAPRIEIAMEYGFTAEEIHFTDSMREIAEMSRQRFADKAAGLDAAADGYGASGQSLILYADDILESTLAIDMGNTLKNILSKRNPLSGGKIIIFAKRQKTARILEEMIKRADPNLDTVVVTEDELGAKGDEVKVAEKLVSRARANGAKELLAIIKGGVPQGEQLDALEKFADNNNLPVVLIGSEKGVYSFAEALALAINAKSSIGLGKGWVILLPPIRSLDEEMQKHYDYYKNSLQALVAA